MFYQIKFTLKTLENKMLKTRYFSLPGLVLTEWAKENSFNETDVIEMNFKYYALEVVFIPDNLL